jgi:diaminopimelate epimerase
VRFKKFEGLGNDFIVVDTRNWAPEARAHLDAEAARRLCDRHFGLGADGLLRLDPEPGFDARMRVLNADGSEAEMCGNGLRCVARALTEDTPRSESGAAQTVRIATGAGPLTALIVGDQIEVELGPARDLGRVTLEVDGRAVTGRVLDLGNPHFVLDAQAGRPEAAALGPRLQQHPAFPNGVNVSCRRILPDGSLELHVWERGCGLTLACGTGAAATAAAARLDALVGDGAVCVRLPGGALEVELTAQGVVQRGPARRVFHGEVDWPGTPEA